MASMHRPAGTDHRLVPRMGFVVDVVEYGRRTSPAQEHVQIRLQSLIERGLDTFGDDAGIDRDAGSGDGMAVFLPVGTDPTRALPGLLNAMTTLLAHDNDLYRDRIRARMAVGFGLVGLGPLGFIGPLIIELSRLNDSQPIRHAIQRHQHSDLAVLVSNTLHDMIRTAYHSDQLPFRQTGIFLKEFCAPAWLWINSPLPHALNHRVHEQESGILERRAAPRQ